MAIRRVNISAREIRTVATETTNNSQAGGSIFPGLNSARGFFTTAGIIGVVGLIAAAVLGGGGSTQADGTHIPGIGLLLQSYMYGYIFWCVITLGCLGMQILTNCIRPTWSVSFLRMVEAGAKNVWLMFVLGLPILGAMWFGDAIGYHLYPWTTPEAAHDPVLIHKSLYLNKGFLTFRYILFFAVWAYYNWVLARGPKGTLAQDKSMDNAMSQYRVNIASPGLVVYGLAMTFFFTDIVMSLDPHWFSTIYGAWWAIVSMGAAIALGGVFITSFYDKKPYDTIATPGLTKDIGNMMLGFTMLYGYFSVSQVLIYWSGNLPEYVSFYYDRFKGPMAFLGFAIIVAQFFVPFLSLIAGRTKRTPWMLRFVGIWIISVRVIDVWYQIEPFFGRKLTDIPAIAVDFAALAAIGGIWVMLFIAEFKKHTPVVEFDTRLQEAKANAGHH